MRCTNTIHQLCLVLCSLVGIGAAGYLLGTTTYDFIGNLKISVATIIVFASIFVLSLLLLLATAFGAPMPVRWLGVLGSFSGSGLYVIYLGLLVSVHATNTFGMVGGFFCFAVGLFFFIFGLAWREKESSGYGALLSP
ncbi:Aste57867_13512 [Aphanomyces stellatus]|uniref:Aste57867_13512 protein n=1 Tax=Aphanomyces stellatus TaxID=120398 RepID=A0A485KZ25_9STRA|nr:hypothetical protein As57867_013462 [Aphanomyces stellatus]VFT90350.1 Aste57867_13512 [Aphanomyces stellatus]